MRTGFLLTVLAAWATTAQAQVYGPLVDRTTSIAQNGITNMAALGDTLWVGPYLSRTLDNGMQWFLPTTADSVNGAEGRGRMFSIALAPDTVVVGLGYTYESGDLSVQTAQGIYLSTDGGDTWAFSNPPLDPLGADSVFYGGRWIDAIAIVVPQQSPPYNVAFRGNVVFTASWASGIRRSTDFGGSWERLVLPPTELDSLVPEQTYDFVFDPRTPRSGDPNAVRYPEGWRNFLGFSVMVDRDGWVWAGTAGGINLSPNALTAPADSVRWYHVRARSGPQGMLGDWVVRMRQHPGTGEVWLTNWTAAEGDEQGLVSTLDHGATFRRHLVGERVNDVGFFGSMIVAAADGGLFISRDNGTSWEQVTEIRSATARLKSSAEFRAVSAGSDRLWIGTTDGLVSTTDGLAWDIQRVDFPLSGGNQFDPEAASVSHYAYPNPFSRTQHEVVRIRFDAPSTGAVRVVFLDFTMQPIRTLSGTALAPGIHELEWDGRDRDGRRVANGPVFYRITVAGRTLDGKLLVLD